MLIDSYNSYDTLSAAAENHKNSCVLGACCVFFHGCCEWLPAAATEREEDHEVSLLWVTAEARASQEEVGCCLSPLWAWGSLGRHDILAKECTVGCWWRMFYKWTMRWGMVKDSARGSGNEPHSGKTGSKSGKCLTVRWSFKVLSMCKHHGFWCLCVLSMYFSTKKYF